MGGIVMTNDGNAILREITVQHPAAKTMIEIARTQDEEVGDGTTSVIVLAAQVLGISHQFLEEKMHPTVVIQAYRQALEDAAVMLRDNVSTKIDMDDTVAVRKVIQSCVGTKFIAKWSDLACDIALDAVKTVTTTQGDKKEIDIKRYAKVEKIPGGTIEESAVLKGVMFNKDVTHPKMKRKIENLRRILKSWTKATSAKFLSKKRLTSRRSVMRSLPSNLIWSSLRRECLILLSTSSTRQESQLSVVLGRVTISVWPELVEQPS